MLECDFIWAKVLKFPKFSIQRPKDSILISLCIACLFSLTRLLPKCFCVQLEVNCVLEHLLIHSSQPCVAECKWHLYLLYDFTFLLCFLPFFLLSSSFLPLPSFSNCPKKLLQIVGCRRWLKTLDHPGRMTRGCIHRKTLKCWVGAEACL